MMDPVVVLIRRFSLSLLGAAAPPSPPPNYPPSPLSDPSDPHGPVGGFH